MSKPTNLSRRSPVGAKADRDTTPRARGSVEHRLAQLLDTSFLARVVPHLPPETLHQLIRHCGLDACGELVTSATPAQLVALLDLDLWNHAPPGSDDQFDVSRFGRWLEVLVDTGPSVAARTVATLDENLVIAGLCRYVRVFDPGIFEPTAQSDDEAPDRHEAMRQGDSIHAEDTPRDHSLADQLECDVSGYVVRARRTDAWDAIVTLLVALDAEHGDYFHAVMRGCRRLSNSRPEIDGLDDLLPAPEQHLHEVALDRARRQSRQGYTTPADARAFLQMARHSNHARSEVPVTGVGGVNPIVKAYFRETDESPEFSNESAATAQPALKPASSTASHASDVEVDAADGGESIDAVIELLTEAGVMPERPRALLEAAGSDPHVRLTRLRQLMDDVREKDATAYFMRSRELAFLGNALLAGCSVQSRPFTPQEAADAAASICNLGLEYRRAPDSVLDDGLPNDQDLVTAFEIGWSVLYQDVSMAVTQELISMLGDLESVDPDIQRRLVSLRRVLVQQGEAGTPWLARRAAEVLAELDMTAWIGLVGLLDECPVMAAALTAILEGRTTAVSATAFEFISTAAQIADIRLFMRKLPDLLAG